MWQANAMLIFNTQEVYANVLQWAYLCSLEKDCIQPITNIFCHFGKGELRRTQHAKCHRFDQSLINILLANWWDFDPKHYIVQEGHTMLDVIRGPTTRFQRKQCAV